MAQSGYDAASARIVTIGLDVHLETLPVRRRPLLFPSHPVAFRAKVAAPRCLGGAVNLRGLVATDWGRVALPPPDFATDAILRVLLPNVPLRSALSVFAFVFGSLVARGRHFTVSVSRLRRTPRALAACLHWVQPLAMVASVVDLSHVRRSVGKLCPQGAAPRWFVSASPTVLICRFTRVAYRRFPPRLRRPCAAVAVLG